MTTVATLPIHLLAEVLTWLHPTPVLKLRSLCRSVASAVEGPWLSLHLETYFGALRECQNACAVPGVIPACQSESEPRICDVAKLCLAFHQDGILPAPLNWFDLIRAGVMPTDSPLLPVPDTCYGVWPWGSLLLPVVEDWCSSCSADVAVAECAPGGIFNLGLLFVTPAHRFREVQAELEQSWKWELTEEQDESNAAMVVLRVSTNAVPSLVFALRRRVVYPDGLRSITPSFRSSSLFSDYTMLGHTLRSVRDATLAARSLPWSWESLQSCVTRADGCAAHLLAQLRHEARRSRRRLHDMFQNDDQAYRVDLGGVSSVCQSFCRAATLCVVSFVDSAGHDPLLHRRIDASFARCRALTQVNFGKSSLSITNGSFNFAPVLKIEMPTMLTSVVASFVAVSLRSLDLRSCVTLQSLYSSFRNCSMLTEVWLPESANLMIRGSFSQCAALTKLHFPHGVTKRGPGILVENGSFDLCDRLTLVDIPDSVFSLSKSFNRCTNLEWIDLTAAEALLRIHDCFNVKKDTMPKCQIQWPRDAVGALKSVGRVLDKSTHLTTLEMHLPPECTVRNAFNETRNLTTVTISCRRLSHCFNNAAGLASVTIGAAMDSIVGCFNHDGQLAQVDFEESACLSTVFECFHCVETLRRVELPPTVRSITRSFRGVAVLRADALRRVDHSVLQVDKRSFAAPQRSGQPGRRYGQNWF